MANKRLLILGMGHSQLDLAKKAKELNLEVYAIADKIAGPVVPFADKVAAVNILDPDAVEAYCVEQKIDFIFTMGLEIALPVIEEVSERLSLHHFFSTDIMQLLKDKNTWREVLGDINGNLKHMMGEQVEDFKNWATYPAVLKPVDGSGQRGVYRVESYEDVRHHFAKSIAPSKKGQLILEEFADGEEISVNSFVYHGELAFYMVSDRISYDEYPGGIIKKHVIPSEIVTEKIEDDIKELVTNVHEKMGIKNGHVYYQLKIDHGEVKLIEFTPRYDGCHMWRLIKEATDLDLLKCSLEWLIDQTSKTLENYHFHVNDGQFITQFISNEPGTEVQRENYELPEDARIVNWYYDNGDKVKKVTGYIEKVGYTIRHIAK